MPKKKGGKKGAKIIDGLATNEMSREQLMGHVKRMQMELEREREERNFFMLEREKLFSLWNMTLEQIAIEKDRARLMEVQVADIEQDKQDEMNIFKQKLRYLMMDQSKKLAAARLNNLEKMKRLQDETKAINSAMSETLNGTKNELKIAKRSIHELKQRLLFKHKLEITNIRTENSNDIRNLESEFGRKFFQWQQDAKTDDRLISLEIEKREQIEDILELHENQLEGMKRFYNDMMTNNFAIIATLQNDLEESKENEERLLMEIKKLKEVVEKLKKMKEAEPKLGKEEAEKPKRDNLAALNSISKMLERKNRYCDRLECINETLLERAMLAEKERDELRQLFGKAVVEMQKKSSMIKLVSDLKINALLKNKSAREQQQSFSQDEDWSPNNFRASNITGGIPRTFLAPPAVPIEDPEAGSTAGENESSIGSTRTAVDD